MTAGARSKIDRLTARPCPAPEQNLQSELVGPASVPAQGRALVRSPSAQDAAPNRVNFRPAANFLAHLIATADGAPQTRARRRAEPGLADALYAATGVLAEPAGQLLRHTA